MADQAAGPQSTPTGKFSTAYLRQLYTPTNLKAALDGDPPFSRLPVIKDSHRLSAEPSFKSKPREKALQSFKKSWARRSLFFARAVRETLNAEAQTAQKRVAEGQAMLEVLRDEAQMAQFKLQMADEQIGSVHNFLDEQGIPEVASSDCSDDSVHPPFTSDISSDDSNSNSYHSDNENTYHSPASSVEQNGELKATLLTSTALEHHDKLSERVEL